MKLPPSFLRKPMATRIGSWDIIVDTPFAFGRGSWPGEGYPWQIFSYWYIGWIEIRRYWDAPRGENDD